MQKFQFARTIARATALSAALTVAYAVPGIAVAAPLKVDPAKSTATATFKQLGVPVEAEFKRFSARIDFDPAAPQNSKAAVDMDVTSFDLGDPDYNREVLKKDWFNAVQYPKASFVASSIKPSPGAPAGTRYDVAGPLTIKGKTANVQFPITIKKEGGQQVFEGTLPVSRLTYNIGEGEWKDTSIVADEVLLKFRIVATQ
jgi:polyisoprenoid-binding protein YceI